MLKLWLKVLLFIYIACGYHLAMAAKAPESVADYAALKGESFKVIRVGKGSQVWNQSVELKLIEVLSLSKAGSTEQFSVRFQGPKKVFLDKAVYQFEQAKTGSFSLFLEQAKSDSKFNYYQATFNFLKPGN